MTILSLHVSLGSAMRHLLSIHSEKYNLDNLIVFFFLHIIDFVTF